MISDNTPEIERRVLDNMPPSLEKLAWELAINRGTARIKEEAAT
jgi:hypothetical protein